MKTIEVYGASDDLIEIEASGENGDELGGGSTPRFLFFADGTVLRVIYGDQGIWRIERVKAGTAVYKHEPGKSPDDKRYSDTVWLTGADLCSPGTNTAAKIESWQSADGPTADEIADIFENETLDFRGMTKEAALNFYRAAIALGVLK